jgi:hypothetical protein
MKEVKRSMVIAVVLTALLPGMARAGNWYDKVKISGDFRHRHELIQDESKDADRTRWRIRARLGLAAEINEEMSLSFRLVSGSDDPVSTNQTLTDGFSTKGIGIDLACFDYHPSAVKGMHLIGGKMNLPFATVQGTELIWDGDLSPEGVAATLSRDINDKVGISLGSGVFYVQERSSDDDSWMAGAQGVVTVKPGDKSHVMAGAGYYDYQNTENFPTFYDDEDPFGNSVNTDGEYMIDYNQFEILGEIGMKVEKISAAVYGNFVKNTAADSLDTGYLFGGMIRHGKGKKSVKVNVNYREVENDAVVGAFTDSDFRNGGTDGKGLELGMSYGLADKIDLAVSYFLNQKGIEEEVDFKRLQVDLAVKF